MCDIPVEINYAFINDVLLSLSEVMIGLRLCLRALVLEIPSQAENDTFVDFCGEWEVMRTGTIAMTRGMGKSSDSNEGNGARPKPVIMETGSV